MKKIQLIVLFVLSAIIYQGCKKDAVTSATSVSDKILNATINGYAWIPDTVDANITYNNTQKTKTFNVVGIANQKRVTMSVMLNNASNVNNFTIGTYKIDNTPNVKFQLDTLSGNSFLQVGVVEPGSGTIDVTAIDSVKNVITGTYSFTTKKVNYDTNGNYISVEISQVLSGSFIKLPYKFISN